MVDVRGDDVVGVSLYVGLDVYSLDTLLVAVFLDCLSVDLE